MHTMLRQGDDNVLALVLVFLNRSTVEFINASDFLDGEGHGQIDLEHVAADLP